MFFDSGGVTRAAQGSVGFGEGPLSHQLCQSSVRKILLSAMGAGIPGTAIGKDLEKRSGGDLLWRSCTVPLGELCPLPQVRPVLYCPWGGHQSPADTRG